MTGLTRLLNQVLIVTSAILFPLFAANAQSPDAKTKGTGSISGRVTIGDKPAPGIVVAVNGLSQQMSARQATSDADGHFRIDGLNAGQFMITPIAPLYVVPGSRMYGPGKSINLASGESIDGIDFTLTKGGVITGRITDADGRPVIEERISFFLVDENGHPSRQQLPRMSNFQMSQTDDRGVFRIFGLPAGHYKISAGDEAGRMAVLRYTGYYPKTYYPDTTDLNNASVVDLSEGGEAKNIDIKLGRRAATFTVTGRIVDADTGQPLPGVQYSFGIIQKSQNESYVEGSASPGTPTNAQGQFRLEGLDPGRYVISASSSRFNLDPNAAAKVYSDPVNFEVIDSDVTDLEIKAQRALSLSGSVLLEGTTDKTVLTRLSKLIITAGIVNPRPANGTNIMFGNGGSASVNPDGSFQIDGLSPGRAQLNIRPLSAVDSQAFTISRIEHERVVQNRPNALQEIEIQPGQDVSGVRIYLAYGTGVIRGQVKVEGGALPNDVIMFVGLVREGTPSRGSAQADSRGRFVIEHVPAGNYEAVLQIVSFGSQTSFPRGFPRTQRQPVVVMDNAETEVLFTLDLTTKE